MFSLDPSSINFFLFLKQTQIDPNFNINNLAGEGRLDLLCRVITNVFFISNGFRYSNLYIYFQRESILIKLIGSQIKKVNPDERSIAGYLKKIFRNIMEGSNRNFDDFLWDYIALEDIPQKFPLGYLLDPKGINIKECKFPNSDPKVFFIGDHLGLNENEKAFLSSYQIISLGNKELLGSQCVTIIYHYLDDHYNFD